jgi:glycosyltransferase involved in cell wall biosynthesis
LTDKNNEKIYVSLVVPCFNEEAVLLLFYTEAVRALSIIRPEKEFEFIFVDDGSKDKTLDILRSLAIKDSHVHYISFLHTASQSPRLLFCCGKRRNGYGRTPRCLPECVCLRD